MLRFPKLLIAVTFASALAACSSTKVTSTWQDKPQRNAGYERILVVAMDASPERRKSFEDHLARDFEHDHVTVLTSTSLLEPETEPSEESLQPLIVEYEIDALIVSRVTRLDVKTIEHEGRSAVLGEGGIRTLDTLLTHTRIPIVRFRPLSHFSDILIV